MKNLYQRCYLFQFAHRPRTVMFFDRLRHLENRFLIIYSSLRPSLVSCHHLQRFFHYFYPVYHADAAQSRSRARKSSLYLLFHQRAAHKGSAARQFNRNTCTRDSLMMDPPDSSLSGPWGGSNVTSVHVGFPLPWGGVLYIALCL